MPYRVVFDHTTKAIKVQREDCRHSLVSHVSRSRSVWSDPSTHHRLRRLLQGNQWNKDAAVALGLMKR